ncbi:hypothetical protein NPIL_303751 [Nephila pilipes]|uniref:Uncharacterized protein n=1 Tax=Nephila pilipes TaxID=299642 RepID=A0A8X6MX71_NEPPI|nr:hypothetical protein NPIL_126641 [Nephila pilipes]GFT00681.1 hypothetical protein NPIL_303751 [Nephila pilipes]
MEPTVKERLYTTLHKAIILKFALRTSPQDFPIALKTLSSTFVSPKGLTRSTLNPFQRYPATTTLFYSQSISTTSRKIATTPSNSPTGTPFNHI